MTRFVLLISTLIALTACSFSPELKSAQDPSLSYRFQGFSLSPPVAEGWVRSDTDSSQAVFYKNLKKREFFQLSAVVTLFNTSVARRSDQPFTEFIEQALFERYQNKQELALLNLTVNPITLNKANCVEFEAQQGKRFFPPVREPRLEFIHKGYVCKHPDAPLLIQGFVTEHRLHDADLELDKNLVQEAQTLIRSIQFTTP
jgi:hypothetical protein